MHSFSKGQKRIGNFILSHYDKAAFMTAAKLGEAVGVSESTVVRFATELGYDGYPELQHALQEMIRNRLTTVQRIEITSDRMSNADVLTKILNMDIEKIPAKTVHYWNLVDIGDGWYHFDTTPRKDRPEIFMWTDEVLMEYSAKHNKSHNYDKSKYPEIN